MLFFLDQYSSQYMVLAKHFDQIQSLYELFSKRIHDLMPVLNFATCIMYSVLSCKSGTSFPTLLIFILSAKMVNHYEVCIIIQDIEHRL